MTNWSTARSGFYLIPKGKLASQPIPVTGRVSEHPHFQALLEKLYERS